MGDQTRDRGQPMSQPLIDCAACGRRTNRWRSIRRHRLCLVCARSAERVVENTYYPTVENAT